MDKQSSAEGYARRRSSSRSQKQQVPAPLTDGVIFETARYADVPDANTLAAWLLQRGLDTSDWGKGDTKEVSAFHKELKLDEAGLELWRKADGQLQPVRVTHVLRAKVCSPDNYDRGIFVFNTWQEYGDGRRRTRNGLLSEKLSMSEMPIEDNLFAVCERAISEEMQRVVDSSVRVDADRPIQFDPNYVSPLKVVHVKFADHTLEVEVSKSYPGLLTMYHLYTVDIVCSGMPTLDFNTLEFKEPDKDGKRKLKYVHAWSWLEWSQIKRYLFEGSKLQEKKGPGCFENEEALEAWLYNFNPDVEVWGTRTYRSVGELYKEVENKETHLEVWSRQDGVALLMRVVHLIQLKVRSSDPRLAGKFVLQTWHQMPDGRSRLVYRFPTRKLKGADLPLNREAFRSAAQATVREELSYICDSHLQLRPDTLPDLATQTTAAVSVRGVEFLDYRIDVEESPSYKGMCTLYHIYTAEVECEGLPFADFASFAVRYDRVPTGQAPKVRLAGAVGWSWITWQQSMDLMHARYAESERRNLAMQAVKEEESQAVQAKAGAVAEALSGTLNRLASKAGPDPDIEQAQELVASLQQSIAHWSDLPVAEVEDSNPSKRVPPSMISKMAESTAPKDMVKALESMKTSRPALTRKVGGRRLRKL